MHAQPYHPYQRTIATTVVVLSIVFALSGFVHGLFEVLQGNEPTTTLFIEAIGPQQRIWVHGTEPAFTILPTYLSAGVATMTVSLMILWFVSHRFRKPYGPSLYLGLFILLTLVGGGIGHVLLFVPSWWFATKIGRPLRISGFWENRKSKERAVRRLWFGLLAIAVLCISYALVVAVTGFVPFTDDPDKASYAMLGFLGTGLLSYLFAFGAAYLRDA